MKILRPRPSVNDIIIHANSSKMLEIKDDQASLILTGPPYFPENVEHFLNEGTYPDENLNQFSQNIISYAWELRSVFEECLRILRPGGHLILQTRDVRLKDYLVPVEAVHREICEALGLTIYTRHFWRPTYITLSRRRMLKALAKSSGPVPFDPEVFLVFKKNGDAYHGEPTTEDLELLQQDFIKSNPGKLNKRHRHQSPISLVNAFIRTYTRAGDLVVDPFAGGGTVAFSAIKLNRLAITYEIDFDSFNLARDNIKILKNEH